MDANNLKKAIRAKCLDCSGGTPAEVARCDLVECPLFPYRMELQTSLLAEDEALPVNNTYRSPKADPGQLKLF